MCVCNAYLLCVLTERKVIRIIDCHICCVHIVAKTVFNNSTKNVYILNHGLET